jgi:Ran GTPase-activating protein (RanGAP) involved in mRNA processing and transport
MKINKQLEVLDLCWSAITSSGCKWLFDGLKNNDSLTTLNLRFNLIDNRGSHSICEAVKHNRSLMNLYLGGNKITDKDQQQLISKYLVNNFQRRQIENIVILLINIARSEHGALPVEIWLIIFGHLCVVGNVNLDNIILKIFNNIDLINQCFQARKVQFKIVVYKGFLDLDIEY